VSVIIDDFSEILPYLDGRRFDENMSFTYAAGAKVEFREDELIELCRNKRVLHIGCCDHIELIKEKVAARGWLHGLITQVSEFTIGVDINPDAVERASEVSGLTNMVAGDITSDYLIEVIKDNHFDIALFGEVVEHIPDPVSFLKKFRENYGANFEDIVITVPNAFRGGNIVGIFKNKETINTDHRFFFTPFTIAKVALDAGFAPKEIRMASYQKAGRLKTMLLNRKPLLAEDIIFIGSHS